MTWRRTLAGKLVRWEAARSFRRDGEDVAVLVSHSITKTVVSDDPAMPDGWPEIGEAIEVCCIDDDCTNDSADPWCRARVTKRRATGSIGMDGRNPFIVAEFIDHPGAAGVEDEGLTFVRLEGNHA